MNRADEREYEEREQRKAYAKARDTFRSRLRDYIDGYTHHSAYVPNHMADHALEAITLTAIEFAEELFNLTPKVNEPAAVLEEYDIPF
jgi:hypothetical protein